MAAHNQLFPIRTECLRSDLNRKCITLKWRWRCPPTAQFFHQIGAWCESTIDFRTFSDPLLDHGDLGSGKRIARFAWRHAAGIGRLEYVYQMAFICLTGNYRVVFCTAFAEGLDFGHVELTFGVLCPVAAKAVFLEDRRNVADEADGRFGRLPLA